MSRIARRRIFALLAALLLALAAAGCGGSSEGNDGGEGQATVAQDVPADAIALVGGVKIPKSAFDRLLAQAESSYKQQKREFPEPGTTEYETLKNQAVQYLVQQAEFRQEAEDLDITITDEEIEKRLAELKEQFFGGDDKQYDKQLEEQGLTNEQVLEDVRYQVLSEKIFESVTKDVKVTDADIEKYYEENKEQFTQPETRSVRHILVTKKAKAQEIHDEIEAGGDFAALAKKFSNDPGSKEEGGKLTVRKGETVPPFDKFSFSAETGDLSQPIKTQFGWHVIEVLSAVKPKSVTPLEDVKQSIRSQLEQQRKNEAMTKWVEDLREKYEGKVAYGVGYVPPATTAADTGTQTGETEPASSAASE